MSADGLARSPELFGAREYSRIGANPLYPGGVYAAVESNEQALYKELVRNSLEVYGIYAVNFEEEFNRVANMPRGQRHGTVVRSGEPFLTINQKGGGFLPDGPYVNRTGKDLIGSLLRLQTDRGVVVYTLLVAECGNVMLLPLPQTQRKAVYKPRRDEYRGHQSDVGRVVAGAIIRTVVREIVHTERREYRRPAPPPQRREYRRPQPRAKRYCPPPRRRVVRPCPPPQRRYRQAPPPRRIVRRPPPLRRR